MTLRLVHDPADEVGDVHVIFEPGHTHVVLTGEVDLALRDELQVAVREVVRASRPVTVDLRHVSVIDTSGLAFLLTLADRVPSRITLLDPSPRALRLLRSLPDVPGRFDLAVRADAGGQVPLPTEAPARR